MPAFTWTADLPFPLEQAADWYSRPGAFTRLVPDFMGHPRRQPSDGLRAGSRSELVLSPAWLPVRSGLVWKALHTQHERTQDRLSFTDTQESGPFRSWTHRHELTRHPDAPARTVVTDTIDWELPLGAERVPGMTALVHRQLTETFRFRTRRTLEDLAFHAQWPEPKMFLVSGANGLIGRQLVAFLQAGGHTVRILDRGALAGGSPVEAGVFDGVDVVVHLAGEPISGRFTDAHKDAVLRSRVEGTRAVVEGLRSRQASGLAIPEALVCASASGFYGHDAGEAAEESPRGDDFLAEVCAAWEGEALRAEELGVRVTRVRTGLVLSSSGGLLAVQLPLFAAGLGGRMGDGQMWQSWIALDDMVRIYAFAALNPAVSGPVNAAAPTPVRQAEFARTLGRVLRRPALLPTPAFGPRLLLGRQGAEEMAKSSIRMDGGRLQGLGFEFLEPRLEGALRRTLGR